MEFRCRTFFCQLGIQIRLRRFRDRIRGNQVSNTFSRNSIQRFSHDIILLEELVYMGLIVTRIELLQRGLLNVES